MKRGVQLLEELGVDGAGRNCHMCQEMMDEG